MGGILPFLRVTLIILLFLQLLGIWGTAQMAEHRDETSALSSRLLIKMPLFLWAFIAAGSIAPMILLIGSLVGEANNTVVDGITGLLVVIGVFFQNYCKLQVGFFLPLHL